MLWSVFLFKIPMIWDAAVQSKNYYRGTASSWTLDFKKDLWSIVLVDAFGILLKKTQNKPAWVIYLNWCLVFRYSGEAESGVNLLFFFVWPNGSKPVNLLKDLVEPKKETVKAYKSVSLCSNYTYIYYVLTGESSKICISYIYVILVARWDGAEPSLLWYSGPPQHHDPWDGTHLWTISRLQRSERAGFLWWPVPGRTIQNFKQDIRLIPLQLSASTSVKCLYRKPLRPWRQEIYVLTRPRPPSPKPAVILEPWMTPVESPLTRTHLIATTWVTQVQSGPFLDTLEAPAPKQSPGLAILLQYLRVHWMMALIRKHYIYRHVVYNYWTLKRN